MATTVGSAILIYNLLALLVMGYDKYQAVKRRWRVPEATLFLLALTGGSPGILAGMFLFRHKIRHKAFKLGIPLIIVVQWWLVSVLIRS